MGRGLLSPPILVRFTEATACLTVITEPAYHSCEVGKGHAQVMPATHLSAYRHAFLDQRLGLETRSLAWAALTYT